MRFYTNFYTHMGQLLLRQVVDGQHRNQKVRIRPYLFRKNPDGEYTTIYGEPCEKIQFDKVGEAREFQKLNEGVDNVELFGATNFALPAINDMYPGEVKFDFTKICVAWIDIEVEMSGSKPDAKTAANRITSIAVKIRGKTYVFSEIDYDVSKSKVQDMVYVKCTNEKALLMRFIEVWASHPIDIVTGWFIDMFDIPYLINRIERVFGPGSSSALSPWGLIEERSVTMMGRENQTFDIKGISVLDYMRLYKKFTYKTRESYRLDSVAQDEEVGKKLDYSEVGTLSNLYTENPQKFIDYNVQDIVLVEKIDEKLNLLSLVCAAGYLFKVNYEDALGTVKPWESLIHNWLMSKKIVVPFKKKVTKTSFEGGYVKEPQKGKHRWVVSFDFDSLYPHLVMALNISTDTIVGMLEKTFTVDEILDGKMPVGEYSTSAAGYTFRKDKQGFFAEIMESIYAKRDVVKNNELKDAKKKYSKEQTEELKKLIAALNAFQLALKYALNSGYGAMANEWFLWFDMRLAESITLSGQYAIRYMARELNVYFNRILNTTDVDYVIAIDTDSVYVTLDTLVEKVYGQVSSELTADVVDFLDRACRERIQPEINNISKKWCRTLNAFDDTKLKMKRETIADVAVFTAKKKYVMNALDVEGDTVPEKDRIKATGLELVKSSTPAVCREKLKTAMKILLHGTEQELQQFVKEFKTEFSKMRFEEVSAPRGVNGISDYATPDWQCKLGTPQHTRACINYNRAIVSAGLERKYDLIQDGDKIRFCRMHKHNPMGDDILAVAYVLPPELGMEKYIDYDTQFTKTFLDPLEIVTGVIGWQHTKKASLLNFF